MPGIVGAVAKAANDEIGVGRTLQLVDAQRGNQRLQVDQIANLRLFDRIGAGDGHRNRQFLKRGFALAGGHDDRVAVDHTVLVVDDFIVFISRVVCRLGVGDGGHCGQRHGGTGKQKAFEQRVCSFHGI